jgi:hypothetical protein
MCRQNGSCPPISASGCRVADNTYSGQLQAAVGEATLPLSRLRVTGQMGQLKRSVAIAVASSVNAAQPVNVSP